jgi:predicted DNA-binding WGR domain protein
MIDIVVVYDRSAASVTDQVEYLDDPAAAFAKRLELERAYRKRGDVEVVLVSARSFDDLKKSHARYFDPMSIRPDSLKLLSERFLN